MHYSLAILLLLASGLTLLRSAEPSATAADAVLPGDVLLGSGTHRYRWVHDWIKLPPSMSLASTHGGVAVDKTDRIYISTENDNAVIVLNPDGTVVTSWGKPFKGGTHDLCIVEDNGREVIWLTHTARGEAIKCTLAGEVLLTIGWPEASGVYKNAKEYKPTSTAIAPNGDVYVADGYGKNYVHRFTAAGSYVSSWNGSARPGGQFKTPHGIGIDRRGPEPRVVVVDRVNSRLQYFTLEGAYVSEVPGFRLPCKAVFRGDDLVVPDLKGRVTILGRENQVICQLGDNPDEKKRANFGVPPEQFKDGEFTAPHGAAWDSQGNLYVEDWNRSGRVSKLERIKY
ncbi:hypothetical protein LBMAG53_24510 [Planctomycetota bacterium]|nr:hypothetical protein LBMAG53_24510 [Planctomycetota bacterium]